MPRMRTMALLIRRVGALTHRDRTLGEQVLQRSQTLSDNQWRCIGCKLGDCKKGDGGIIF
jgi:hypothetical protein